MASSPRERRRLSTLARHVRRVSPCRMASRAAPPSGATTTASSAALQHEVAPVEMSEREKFLLDMNGEHAQPVIWIDKQFSFKPVDL